MSSTPAPVTLKPDVRLPLLVVALGLALLPLPLSPWPTLVVDAVRPVLADPERQPALEFKEDALIVWQNGRELRRFPYDQWLSWRLFAPGLPGLFYFRETQSIHFLPILFSPKELREQLELRVGALEVPKEDPKGNTKTNEP
jgi:hypothetical protein